jgi:hypothetical protein
MTELHRGDDQKRQANPIARATHPPLPEILDKNCGIMDSLRVSVESFQMLRGLKAHEVEGRMANRDSLSQSERDALTVLEQISKLTQEAMARMNEAHPGLPPDSLATTLGLVTRPGASVVVLHGRPNADLSEPAQVLGYGIVIRGKENFPEHEAEDPAHRIPEVLFEGADVHHRLIRLFVTDAAREQEVAGKAFGLIIDQVKSICNGEPIIGMVLTDLLCMEVRPGQAFDKRIWLEAKAALEKRGFEDTGFGLNEVIARDGQPTVTIPFRWYMFPPRTEQGRQAYGDLQRRYDQLESQQRERLAGVATELPLSGAKVFHLGNARDPFDIASISGNQFYAQVYNTSNRGDNRVAKRWNLVSWPHAQNLSPPDSSMGAVIINGILPDLAGGLDASGAREAIENFTKQQLEIVRDGGSLIIRDTVAPSHNAPVYLYLNRERPVEWSGNKTPAKLFEEFVESRRERAIPSEDWNAVKRMQDDGTRACFYVPGSIAAEFQLKCLYWSDWDRESKRPYTVQTPEERIDFCRSLGLRLVYAAPERSSFIHGRLQAAGISTATIHGTPNDPLSTNHVSVWQRVAPEEGVGIRVGDLVPFIQRPFVAISCYDECDGAGEVTRRHEVASRPGATIDVVPYRIDKGRLYVWGRVFPRPISLVHPSLDGTIHGGYANEQLAGIVDSELAQNPDGVAAAARVVFERVTGTSNSQTLRLARPSSYFVRPHTVDERVIATPIEAPELPLQDVQVDDPGLHFGGKFSVRAFEALSVLQGGQVGHRQDARLERIVYQLLLQNRLSCGPWITERAELMTQESTSISVMPADAVLGTSVSARFQPSSDQLPRHLATYRRAFTEYTAAGGEHDRTRELEYVEPATRTGLTPRSISIIPVAKVRDAQGREEILVGLTVEANPAVEAKTGSASFVTIPTARLASSVHTLNDARRYADDTLTREFGVSIRAMKHLGGKYSVSAGITPETISPYVAEVNLDSNAASAFRWVKLEDLLGRLQRAQCAQLITSIYRFSHSQGLL